MSMLEHRVQLLLDEPRYRKVQDEAVRRGTSIAIVIREAIDRLPADPERKRRAVAEILAASPMPVPDDPAELKREITEAHGRIP